ncbi:MAG: CDP-alcohol phosphatidyltransferase family protein [Cellulosilyticaceae bacterium]
MKHLANSMTFLRFVCAFLILFTKPFSLFFWVLYILCGLTDVLDGAIARRLHIESALGAKLDSMADMMCIFVLMFVLLPILYMPTWMWFCIAAIVCIRITSYIIGFIKYHTFASLHTYLNKATGLLLFITPVLYVICGMHVTSLLLGLTALLSALEELGIILLSKNLDTNCKGLFTLPK